MLHWRGDPLAARETLVAEALRLEQIDPRRAADVLATALHASWFCMRRELVLGTAAALARVAIPAEAKEDARLSAMTGGALTICGRLEAAEPYLRRSIELAERADPFALVYAATSHGWLCNYRAARDLTTRALESGQQQGAAGSEAFASEMLAEYENALGEHDAAGAIWSEGARKAEEAEQPHPLAWCRMSLALIAANREGEQQARRLVDSALQAEQPLWYMGVDGPAWVLATSALARGDGETAAGLLADSDPELCQVNYTPWTIGADLVEARVRAGNPAAAEATLRALAPHARQA
jgi:tetratricopeptide (TPR) repeat protein